MSNVRIINKPPNGLFARSIKLRAQSMSDSPAGAGINLDYYRVDHNQDLVLKLLTAYYRAHHHSGKLFDDFPSFFLVKPEALSGANLATRASDKLILEDCIQRATDRSGYIGITKHRNPKLQYYWLELVPMPTWTSRAATWSAAGPARPA